MSNINTGKNNSLAYRNARRTAHNAQTELANMISSLSTEPNPNPELVHHAFRYLVYSHSQLSYISALGSHRELVQDTQSAGTHAVVSKYAKSCTAPSAGIS